MKKNIILTSLLLSVTALSYILADDSPSTKRQSDNSKKIIAPRDYSKEIHTSSVGA